MMAAVMLLFWFSLRLVDIQIELTVAAIGMWGITYFVNRKLKDEEDQSQE